MKASEFVNKALKIKDEPTIYVLGGLGQMITADFINRHECYPFNRPRRKMYENKIGKAYAFDCVGLIKSVFWGWNKGRFEYQANKVPDITEYTMINDYCNDVSSDISTVEIGEVVWLKGHIGIYIGGGNVLECTPKWKNCVQITKLTDRHWLKHGKLVWVDYVSDNKDVKQKVKDEFGFDDITITYFSCYKHADELFKKLLRRLE